VPAFLRGIRQHLTDAPRGHLSFASPISARPRVATISILFVATIFSVSSARGEAIFPGVGAISETDARQSAIAFVNTSTSPGLEGATLRLDTDTRHSEQWRSSLGFNAEFTLKEPVFNGYWGLALLGGGLKDQIQVAADDGRLVQLDLTRQVVAARGSAGLSFPIDQNLKVRPVLSLILADLQTEGIVNNLLPTPVHFENSATLVSGVLGLNALYTHWYGEYKVNLTANYNLIYTDSVSENNPLLDTHAWNRTAQLKSDISGSTKFITAGRPWRWQAYLNYTNFLSTDELSLGYTNLIDIGGGLDWQLNIKPLDWFGWRSVGLRAGVTVGKDLEGYTIGMTAQ